MLNLVVSEVSKDTKLVMKASLEVDLKKIDLESTSTSTSPSLRKGWLEFTLGNLMHSKVVLELETLIKRLFYGYTN